MNWRIETLSELHDCRRFRCGEHALDAYLRRHALSNDRRGLGRTYVAVDCGTSAIPGYVTLCTSAIHFAHVPAASLPHYPIPTLRVARLAVERSAQGKGVGTALTLTALRIAVEVAERAGVFAVTVDAKSEPIRDFYQQRFGFSELLDDPLHLFVTIEDLRASGLCDA